MGLNTTESRATGFTPFRLMYRAEVMTPRELKHGSPRSDPSVTPDVDELTTNYLLNGDQVQSLNALSKYQTTTKSWGDRVIIPQIVQRRRHRPHQDDNNRIQSQVRAKVVRPIYNQENVSELLQYYVYLSHFVCPIFFIKIYKILHVEAVFRS